jgi:hypothetical protein
MTKRKMAEMDSSRVRDEQALPHECVITYSVARRNRPVVIGDGTKHLGVPVERNEGGAQGFGNCYQLGSGVDGYAIPATPPAAAPTDQASTAPWLPGLPGLRSSAIATSDAARSGWPARALPAPFRA